VVVGKWTGDLDMAQLQRQLNNETQAEAEEPEAVLDQTEVHMPVRAQVTQVPQTY
jgi:aerobic C4-dicarboxylate transport protein